jgi:hypothetical protein
MKKINAQNLLEYILILAMVAVACSFFVSKLDLKRIKNYVFNHPAESSNPTQIKIEPMTEGN